VAEKNERIAKTTETGHCRNIAMTLIDLARGPVSVAFSTPSLRGRPSVCCERRQFATFQLV